MSIMSRFHIIKRFLALCPQIFVLAKSRQVKKRLLPAAMARFEDDALPDGASFDDYKKALSSHLVSFDEYIYNYEFWNKDENERNEFISRASAAILFFRIRLAFPKYDNPSLFWFKEQFLKRASELGFMKRDWLLSTEASKEQIAVLFHKCDCIVKPNDSSMGEGIFKVYKDNEDEIEKVVEQCVSNPCIIEECVIGCQELQQFHPSSLNTLRVVTIAYEGKAKVFGACFRMGQHDSVVDNSHGGGLVASIDVSTGIIVSNAFGTHGKYYRVHPDTKMPIKGFQIPNWEKVKQRCVEAANVFKGVIVVGWDLTITPSGDIEFIEANHTPDFDGGMQAPLKQGVKKSLYDTIREITGKSF